MSGSEMKKPGCFGDYPFHTEKERMRDCPGCSFSVKCQKVTLFEKHAEEQKSLAQGDQWTPEQVKQVGGDHYDKMKIDPWDVWDTWPLEQRIGAYRSNAIKYLMRMGTKDNPLQELKKARHYINKLIEVVENA